ncbi:hypothetical protein Tco_0606303 [Tanacetum coccineum]
MIHLSQELSDKVLALETDLQQTKKVYSTAVTKLIMKVKRLEKIVKSSKARIRAKIVVSDDEKVSKDSSNQGRMIDDIDQDARITLVTPTKTSTQKDHLEDQLGVLSAAKVLTDVARVHTYSRRRRIVSTGSGEVSTASRIISTAKETVSTTGASMPVSIAGLVQEITSSSRASKDKVRSSETKRAGQEVLEEPAKRQKIGEASGSGEEQSTEKEKEVSEEELHKLLVIVPVEEVYIEALQIFEDMLKRFDRDDLEKLWDLVKKRFRSTEPTVDKEKVLWVELKRLFEPDDDDTLWKLQRYMHDPLKWRLYDTCGVHHVSTERGHDIFMLVEKDYPLTRALMTVMLANKLQVDESSEMANELLKKIFILANNPRQ